MPKHEKIKKQKYQATLERSQKEQSLKKETKHEALSIVQDRTIDKCYRTNEDITTLHMPSLAIANEFTIVNNESLKSSNSQNGETLVMRRYSTKQSINEKK